MNWLTQTLLHSLLHYDPVTGLWTWMNPFPRSKVRRGDPAGRITSKGYRQLRLGSQFFVSGRLAFFYMTGEWPKDEVDHINRIKHDDRWDNLREATRSQNAFNRDWCETNGDMRGIYFNSGNFAVYIGNKYHGRYPTAEEAIVARDVALKELAGPFAIISSERKIS